MGKFPSAGYAKLFFINYKTRDIILYEIVLIEFYLRLTPLKRGKINRLFMRRVFPRRRLFLPKFPR